MHVGPSHGRPALQRRCRWGAAKRYPPELPNIATERGYRGVPLKGEPLRSPSAATAPSGAVYGPIPRKPCSPFLRGRTPVSGRRRASQQLRAAGWGLRIRRMISIPSARQAYAPHGKHVLAW